MAAPPAKPAPSVYDLRADARSALVVVDIQRDWYSASDLVSNAFPQMPENVEELLGVFRGRGVPVVHVRAKYDCPTRSAHMSYFKHLNPEKPGADVSVEPEPWAAELPGELVVYKPTFDGFHNTSLHAELQRMGVERVYVCGLVTAACVLNTCFGAFRHGYEVVLISDCTADRSRAQHDAVLSIYNGYTFIAANLTEISSFVSDGGGHAGTKTVRRSAEETAALYAACERSSSSARLHKAAGKRPSSAASGGREDADDADRHEARGGAEPNPEIHSPTLLHAAPSFATSLSSLSSTSSLSSAASSVASQPHSTKPLFAAVPSAPAAGRGMLETGLSNITLLVRAVSMGIYCIAAGHGLEERLILSPAREAQGGRALRRSSFRVPEQPAPLAS